MPRIYYISSKDGSVLAYADCIKLPDPPQDPRISKAGWPDPVGIWNYIEVKKS